MKRNFKTAFTLAEVLITLGIIGVVAAMTLPSLIADHQKKKAVTQLKKEYSTLQQAILMAENEFGPINDWADWDNAETILTKYIAPYVKHDKIYPVNTMYKSMCYENGYPMNDMYTESQYVWLSKVHIGTPFLNDVTASIQLTGGTCLGLNSGNNGVHSKKIFIDINGSMNKPNMAGKDLFFFYVNDQGFIKPQGDDWIEEDLKSNTKQNACNQQAPLGGQVCTARIMAEGWEIKY